MKERNHHDANMHVAFIFTTINLISILLVIYDFSGRQISNCLSVAVSFVFLYALSLSFPLLTLLLFVNSSCCCYFYWSCLCHFFSQLCSINIRRKQINCNPNKYGKNIRTLLVCVHIVQ